MSHPVTVLRKEINSPFFSYTKTPVIKVSTRCKLSCSFNICAFFHFHRVGFKVMKVTNKMQLYRLIYYSKSALHVSGKVFAHHQEHLTVFTVSGSVHPSSCRLVSWMSWKFIQDTSRQLLGCTHLTVFTVSGSIHPSCCRLVPWISWNSFKTPTGSYLGEHYQIL
jgi:hypothetical protein